MATIPAAPLVNATRFRNAHAEDWQRLDDIVTRIEKKSLRALSDEELFALPGLYRTTLSSLALARDTSLDRGLVLYLEQLCARAYFHLYGVQTPAFRQVAQFFRHDWPAAVRALWRETLASALLTGLAALMAYLLIRADPSWYYSIIPQGLAGGRDPAASYEDLRATLYTTERDGLGVFATFLFTNNSQVAIFAFALGFALAVPTILLLLYNGMMLGAIFAVFAAKGLAFNLAGWLMIHGTTEILAICIAGAAGMRIGLAVIFPGARSRMSALVAAGRTAAVAMIGTVIMLAVAGILEGFGRQMINDDAMRMAVGGAALALWLVYFYLWGSKAARDAR